MSRKRFLGWILVITEPIHYVKKEENLDFLALACVAFLHLNMLHAKQFVQTAHRLLFPDVKEGADVPKCHHNERD